MRNAALFAIVISAIAGTVARAQSNEVKPLVVWTGHVNDDQRIKKPLGVEVPNTYGEMHHSYRIDDLFNLTSLWGVLGRQATVPDMDFSRVSVVVIFKDAINPRITTTRDGTLLDFDVRMTDPGAPAYTIAVFPKEAVNSLRRAK